MILFIYKKLHVSNLINNKEVNRYEDNKGYCRKEGRCIDINARYIFPKLTNMSNMAVRIMMTQKIQILTVIANDLTNMMYGEIVMTIERTDVEREIDCEGAYGVL